MNWDRFEILLTSPITKEQWHRASLELFQNRFHGYSYAEYAKELAISLERVTDKSRVRALQKAIQSSGLQPLELIFLKLEPRDQLNLFCLDQNFAKAGQQYEHETACLKRFLHQTDLPTKLQSYKKHWLY